MSAFLCCFSDDCVEQKLSFCTTAVLPLFKLSVSIHFHSTVVYLGFTKL